MDNAIEDFDFHELTGDMANSISDELYRRYLPELAEKHKKEMEDSQDENIRNDMEVGEIVNAIDQALKNDLADAVSKQMKEAITEQLLEQYKPEPKTAEALFDNVVLRLRWTIALFFIFISLVLVCIGLVIAGEAVMVVAKTVKFLPYVFKSFYETVELTDTPLNEIQAGVLSILDLILIASLVVMVSVGGYENTISRIGMSHQLPSWFGKLDIGQLKIKVAASIVIISSIHLLMSFINLRLDMVDFDYEPLMWIAITHVVFVLSALILAYMDDFTRQRNSKE